MVIGSHNSWSYLPVRKWWMRPLRFMAKCQRVGINEQYVIHDVRCFDLRIRFEGDRLVVAHGIIEYMCDYLKLISYLDYLDRQGDCYVRVIHEVRTRKQWQKSNPIMFADYCGKFEKLFPRIHFWCGRNLYDWTADYKFKGKDPSCDEKYASVTNPKLVDDWWPWFYAWRKNKEIRKAGSDKDVLLIDYIDIK